MRFRAITIGLLITFAAALGIVSLASAQVVPNVPWNINFASGTITPRPSNLQLPCANIVGGCISTSTGPYAQKSNNGSDFTSTSTALTNLGAAGNASNNILTGNNTSTGSFGFTGAVAANAEVDFSYGTIVMANATSGATDYGQYLNNFCASVTANASSALILVPSENVTFSTPIIENQRCTYEGVAGGGTVWNWNGAQGTFMTQTAWPSTPHIGGGGFVGITFVNLGSATTTNYSTAILMASSSLSGGAHGNFQFNTFTNWGVPIIISSGTYDPYINRNHFRYNGACIWTLPANNSGESVIISNNWCTDQLGGNASDSIKFFSSSVENAFLTDNTVDTAQVHIGSNNQVFISHLEIENSSAPTPYIPVVIDNSPSSNVTINGMQVHNDGITTSTTYAAIISVDSTLNITGLSVSKSANASSVPIVFTNQSGASGNENLTACGVTNNANSGNAYTNLFGGAANIGVPSSTFNGCINQYKNGYAYGQIESSVGNANQELFINGGGVWSSDSVLSGGGATTGNTFGVAYGTAVASSTLDVNGDFGCLLRRTTATGTTITGAPTNTNGGCTWELASTTVANATFTLPFYASSTNRIYHIVNASPFNLQLATQGSDLIKNINGGGGTTASLLVASETAIDVQGDILGGNWLRIR